MDDVRAVLFGLEGFEVLDAVEGPEGLEVTVQTVGRVLGCPSCGTPAGPSRGRPKVRLRDVCSAGRRVRVWWQKQRRRCPDPDCDRRSFTEQHPAVGARRRTTARCRAHVADQVGPEGRAVTAVAAEVGLSWPTAMRCVHEEAESALASVQSRPTRWLGVDETTFRVPRRFVTNIADVEAGIELDVFEGRSSLRLGDWLAGQPSWWRQSVEVVAMDASAPFRSAVRQWLPEARVVLDRFHALRLFHQAIDEIRRRTAWDLRGRRGRKVDPIWVSRRLLLTAYERLRPGSFDRLLEALAVDDPDGEIAWAYLAKEQARHVWKHPSIGAWGELLVLLADSDIPELVRLGGTLDRWHDEIINSFELPVTNAATEGLNRKVKHVKRVGCGFRNPANYRTRVLLHCGPHRP